MLLKKKPMAVSSLCHSWTGCHLILPLAGHWPRFLISPVTWLHQARAQTPAAMWIAVLILSIWWGIVARVGRQAPEIALRGCWYLRHLEFCRRLLFRTRIAVAAAATRLLQPRQGLILPFSRWTWTIETSNLLHDRFVSLVCCTPCYNFPSVTR